MTRAEAQARIDARGTVVIPAGSQVVCDGPLYPRSWAHVDWQGCALVPAPGYTGPLLTNSGTDYETYWSWRHFRMECGWQCKGVEWTSNTPATPGYPFYFALEDWQITRPTRGYHDPGSGAFQYELRRGWIAEALLPNVVNGGTTGLLETLFCGSAGNDDRMSGGWEFWNLKSHVIRNVAMDQHRARPGAPAYLLRFCDGTVVEDIPGSPSVAPRLSVDGTYAEGNVSYGGPLFLVDRCTNLSWHGLGTLYTRLAPPAGRAAYLLQWHQSTGELSASVGGGDRRTPDREDGDPSGHSVTLFVTGADTRLRLTGTVNPCDKAAPGPRPQAIAYGLGATPAHVDAGGCKFG